MCQVQVLLEVYIFKHPSQDYWANGQNLFRCTFELSFESLQGIIEGDTVCWEGVAHSVVEIADTADDILDVSITT